MTVRTYASPLAFKQALEERLRAAATEQGRAGDFVRRTSLAELTVAAAGFFDPVLGGSTSGTWDPGARRWTAR